MLQLNYFGVEVKSPFPGEPDEEKNSSQNVNTQNIIELLNCCQLKFILKYDSFPHQWPIFYVLNF